MIDACVFVNLACVCVEVFFSAFEERKGEGDFASVFCVFLSIFHGPS